jgi:hypothetical protein
MEQSPSSEVNNHSASQGIPRLLRNPKVHFRVRKSPPLISIMSQMNPVHNLPRYFPKIHSNIILPFTPMYSECSLPLTNAIQQSPSWEADSRPASQEILRHLWNTKVHYRVQNSTPLDLIVDKINPVHILTPHFLKINLILSFHLCLGMSSCLFPC